jgi:two-component system response regulator AtoC
VEHFPVEWLPQPQLAEPAAAGPEPSDLDLPKAVDALEARMILEALRRCDGNKTKAAALLKISGRSLWYKLDKYGIGK